MPVKSHVILKLPFHKLEFKALQRTSISVEFIFGYSNYKYEQIEKNVTRLHTDSHDRHRQPLKRYSH